MINSSRGVRRTTGTGESTNLIVHATHERCHRLPFVTSSSPSVVRTRGDSASRKAPVRLSLASARLRSGLTGAVAHALHCGPGPSDGVPPHATPRSLLLFTAHRRHVPAH